MGNRVGERMRDGGPQPETPNRGATWLAAGLTALGLLAFQACVTRDVVTVEILEITVRPATASLLEGEQLQFEATVEDADGGIYAGAPVTWASDSTDILAIDSLGMISAVSAGSTFVSASLQEVTSTARVIVIPAPSIQVTPDSVRIFGATGPRSPSPVEVDVRNGGGGNLRNLTAEPSFPAGEAEGWLTATLDNSSAPSQLTLTTSTETLATGLYTVEVIVSSPDDRNSPTVVPVVLSLTGATVTETDGGTTVTEAGSTDSLSVFLDARPDSAVVLQVVSDDPGEVTVTPGTVTFTPDDWNVPQVIVLTGVDELTSDGDVVTDVTIAVDSTQSDEAYAPIPPDTIRVTTVDDDAAGFTLVESGATTTVDEAGGMDTITVVLDAQPESPVVLAVEALDPTEVAATPTTMTFTSDDWDVPQRVTVTGVDDALVDGDLATPVRFTPTADSDPTFAALEPDSTLVTNEDDDGASITVAQSPPEDPADDTTQVTEGGGSDDFTVVLDAQPVQNVVLSLIAADTGEVTVEPVAMTFTPGSWSTPQTVTLTGVDDAELDGDQVTTVTIAVDPDASDPDFAAMADRIVEVTTVDDDDASFLVTESDGSTSVAEAGGADTVRVVLLAEPSGEVLFDVTSGDPTESTVSPASLAFTASNWDQPQEVTVLGVDDFTDDGDLTTAIRVAVDVAGSDDDFDAVPPDSILVTTIDDDTAGLTIEQSNGQTVVNEVGDSDSLTVVLDAQPLADDSDVVLTLFSNDTTEVSVSPSSLVFTAANWNIPRVVTVTGVDDIEFDQDQTSLLVIAVLDTLSDATYRPVPDRTVVVTTIDNDANAGFNIGQVTTSVDEGTTTAGMTLVLTTQPSSDVVLGVTTADPSIVTPTPGSVTFTSADWNAEQVVSVIGVDDDLIDGDLSTTLTVSVDTAQSDAAFDAVPDSAIVVTALDDDVAGVLLADTGSVVVNESGTTDQFTVRLAAQPVDPVVFSLASSNEATGATVSPDSLTFTTTNWDVPQSVAVTGADDDLIDGDQLSTVVLAVDADRSDDAFDAVPSNSVNVITTDDDQPAFSLTHTGGTTDLSEAGPTADSLVLVLTAQPASVVTFDVTSGDPTEAAVPSVPIEFTTFNWSEPQYIPVTGVDDGLVDGRQSTEITVAIDPDNTDDAFDGLAPQTLTVSTVDDDVAGFLVSPTNANTAVPESGTPPDTLEIVLTAEPLSQVVLGVSGDDAGEATVSPSALTFTSSDWSTPQYVVVTGVDDDEVDGDQSSLVTVAVNADFSDAAFDGLSNQTQTVTTLDDDEAGFTLAHTNDSTVVSEDGSADTVTVVLTARPLGDVTLDVSSAEPTETSVSQPQLTFTNQTWATPQVVVVTGVDDGIVDGSRVSDVDVSVNAASSDDAFDDLAPQSLPVRTLDDDEAGFLLTETAGTTSVSEDGATDSLSVVLTAEPLAPVVFDIFSDDLDEVVTSPTQLVFGPGDWDQPQIVVVNGVDDDFIDGPATVTLTIAVNDNASADAFDGLSAQVSVSNDDDDQPGVTLADTASTTLTEDGGSDPFTVVLDAQPTSPVALTVTSSDGTEASTDPTTVTFDPSNWSTPKSVVVRGVDDFLIDGTQTSTITVAIDAAGSDDEFDALPPVTFQAQTEDDDQAGLFVDEIGGTTVNEGGSEDYFTVVLGAQPVSDVVVTVSSLDTGEATASPTTLSFTPSNWDSVRTVTVTGVDDPQADGDQTTPVALAVDAAASDDDFDALVDTVYVTTRDDDGVGIMVTEVGSTWVEEAGSKLIDEFAVRLTSQPASAVVLSIASSDPTEATAAALEIPLDSLVFTPSTWDTEQVVNVTGVDDPTVDGDITSTVSVAVDPARSDNAFDTVSVRTVSVETRDDDQAGFTLADTTGLEVTEDGSGTDTFTITIDAQPLADVVLDVTANDPDEVSVLPSSLTFTPSNWDSTRTVEVVGVDDSVDDGDVLSTITVNVNDGSSDALWTDVPDQTVGVTTIDDDAAVLSIGDVNVGEGDVGTVDATFTVALTTPSDEEVTVDYTTTPGSATESGDYVSASGTLTFSTGEISKTITVPVNGDTLDEDDETFTVDLSNAVNATISDGSGLGTILDDDPLPSLSIDDVTVTEADVGTQDAVFTVTLSTASGRPVTVDYTTADGTATTADADYAASSGTLTFPAGTTIRTITVPVNGDVVDEGASEAFTVDLSAPVNATIDDGSGIGTIIDDDTATLSIDDVSVDEGDVGTVNATFTVEMSTPRDEQVTVGYATADQTATAEGDYLSASGTLTFPIGATSQTLTVPINGDILDEEDETFTVELSNPSNATVTDGSGLGTILDNDPIPSLSIDDVTVNEGDSGTVDAVFTVTLTAASGRTVAVDYTTNPTSATEGGDYLSASGTLTFLAGEISKTITVPVNGDTLHEIDETFTVELSNAVNATISNGVGVGTINDDEPVPSLSIDSVTVTEVDAGGTVEAVFTVSLSAASGQQVRVDYETFDGTATQPGDYQSASARVTFPEGTASMTITVVVNGDDLGEPDETFEVRLSNESNATIANGIGIGTILDNDPQ